MTREDFNNLITGKIIILDGATGTELQKRGMPRGVCPEKWVFDNPDVLIEIQKKYIEAGSDVVYSCTFGGNRYKLEEFDLSDKVYELNKRLAEISKKAVGDSGYVAGDIAPTGKFVEPFGDVRFEDAVDVFKEQAQALLDGGVDLFIIETMIDIQEMRAAVIAIREICDLPIIASMTYSEEGFTLTGTDPVSALITLQSLGAAAVGCNCSTGPDTMVKIIKKLKPFAKVPLIAKPNAGLPKLVKGETVFDMNAEEFGNFIPDFVSAGVNLIGGCCGTSFDFINQIKIKTKNVKPVLPEINSISALSSARSYVLTELNTPMKIIGERINPTGKKKLQTELREGKFNEVKRFAVEQGIAGAHILDVNMGMSGIDEQEMMLKSVKLLSTISKLPLSIDSSSSEVIEKALRLYPGRALINSISAEKIKLEKLLPIAAKYGAMFILLPLDDDSIPKTADGRIKLVNKIYESAKKFGFTKNDIIVDGLVMTISSDQKAAAETLKLINWSSKEFGVNTVVGLSNVSFGLPQRKHVNASFLTMAIYNGLTTAIANPQEEILINAKIASDALVGNDEGCREYINKFSKAAEEKKETVSVENKSISQLLFDGVLNGEKENIVKYVKKALKEDYNPNDIVNNYLIKAINKVGDLYDKKVYFLPQLIASAESMKLAFNYLEPFLSKDEDDSKQDVKIILATVKGDIHDIGKNIVALMLKNYGYQVIDLGKDVPADKIIDAAIENNSKIIGLSALMTTTMVEMKNVVDIVRSKKLDIKIIVGGAVINDHYAEEIGADGYAADSIEAVKLVGNLVK